VQLTSEHKDDLLKNFHRRSDLSPSLLDLEDKLAFLKAMNFNISIPKVFARISPTYFVKLSTLLDSITT
jgi:hypothetical protein